MHCRIWACCLEMSKFMTAKYLFPVATQSYFRAINIDVQRTRFLESSDYSPRFIYPGNYNEELVLSRQAQTTKGSVEYDKLNLVLCSIRLQKDSNELIEFNKLNDRIFGAPIQLHAQKILSRMLTQSTERTKVYSDEIIRILNFKILPDAQFGPNQDVFLKYKKYFSRYRHASEIQNHDVAFAIKRELVNSGMAEKGWVLQLVKGKAHARTNHQMMKIKLGRDYHPRTLGAAERIAVHEVYSHALRGKQSSETESEGFAMALEQLLASCFKPRRSYRYLAASLGWGVFGRPMAFRDVFEIIWRLMRIISRYSEADAKAHAFNECYRVFRGGRADLAGAVYLKDIVYFESNLKVWDALSIKDIDYDKFVDIIEGRSTITI